jgi:hypothetical protein
MAEKSLEERVSALEGFVGRVDELDKQWDAKLKPLRIDLSIIKHAVGMILTKLT